MISFRVAFFLLVFSISARFQAEGKDDWFKEHHSDKGTEKQIYLGFTSVQDKLDEALENKIFPGRTEKIEFIRSFLKKHAYLIQKPVQDFLTSQNIPYKSIWISNSIFIPEYAYKKIKNKIKKFSAIVEVRLEEELELSQSDVVEDSEDHTLECPPTEDRLTWGLEKMRVREAWEIADGTGIVIGSIDTGVRLSHEAIRENYLNSDRSWYDPIPKTETPRDADENIGHGTHTIGTMVGKFGIGVAPGAKFIACIGCDATTCMESWLYDCGQFMLCPTRPDGTDGDCSQAPRIVNNSWGSTAGVLSNTYLNILENWIKADIVPVFAIGNSGPRCSTTCSPGNLAQTIGVGASDPTDTIAGFSSRGPAPENSQRIKPDITAPGVEICSASVKGDDLYRRINGTSMAAPHISGVIALMLSVHPERNDITVDDVKNILYNKNALQTEGLKTNDGKWTCNEHLESNPDDPDRRDNYFGRGISIALEAVTMARDSFKTHN